jgi:hypothetical protein
MFAALQQHIQGHTQFQGQKAGAIGRVSTPEEGPADLMSQVASNAQKIAQSVQKGSRQAANTGQSPFG